MKLYREVNPNERTPLIEKGCTICHKTEGPMYCWWVPEDKWWEDANEYAYGNQDVEYWLEPIEITEEDIGSILSKELGELINDFGIEEAAKAILSKLKDQKE